ncbi:MAG: hypothetical protein ACFFD4_07005 [Candidatus Odinarchaeota archaeon]
MYDALFKENVRKKIRSKLNWTYDFLEKAQVENYILRILVTDRTGLLIEDFRPKKSGNFTEIERKVSEFDGDMSAAFISGILAQSDKLLLDTYDLLSESHILSTQQGPTILLYSITSDNYGAYLAIFTNGREEALQKIGTGVNFLIYGLKTILTELPAPEAAEEHG